MSRQLFQYHPTIGFHFIPSVKARVPHEAGGYLVRTNAAGFRSDREFTREKPPGAFRVLLFGDSYTAGDGVSNGARYGDVLENLIPGLEVFNFALPGTGTDQHYLVYRELAAEIEHDLVVIAVLVENIRRIVAHYREFESATGERILLAKPFFTRKPDGRLSMHNVPVPKEPLPPGSLGVTEERHVDRGGDLVFVRRVVNKLAPGVKSLIQRVVRQNPLPAYDRANHPAWLLMKAILMAWVKDLRVPAIIMPVPLYHYVEDVSDPDNYLERFGELALLPRVTVHNPLPDFRAVPRAQRRAFRFEVDVHPTPAAHRVMAESLAKVIRPLMPMPRTLSA